MTLATTACSSPVDFRSLKVREFRTIYEGLLESSLSLAETDLTFDDSAVGPRRQRAMKWWRRPDLLPYGIRQERRRALTSHLKIVVDHD